MLTLAAVVLIAVGLGAGRLAPSLQKKFNVVASVLVMIVGLEFVTDREHKTPATAETARD